MHKQQLSPCLKALETITITTQKQSLACIKTIQERLTINKEQLKTLKLNDGFSDHN
jgi:hypothetical protein